MEIIHILLDRPSHPDRLSAEDFLFALEKGYAFLNSKLHKVMYCPRQGLNLRVCSLCGRSLDRIPASYLCNKHVGNVTGNVTSIQSAGVAPEVNLRNSMQTRKHASEGIHPGFETHGRRHQKSKTGVSVATQKGLVSYKK